VRATRSRIVARRFVAIAGIRFSIDFNLDLASDC